VDSPSVRGTEPVSAAKEQADVTVTRLEVQRRQPPPPGPARRQRPREPEVAPEPPARPLSRTARRAAAEDAKLLAALRVLFSNPSLYPRVFYLALGFAAITSLGVALAGAVPLPFGLRYAVVPAAAVLVVLSLRHPAWGKRALLGLVAGMLATGVYDVLRIGLVYMGLWGDPIPSIGRLALADPNADPVWGYVWRFIGNGGGMGLAFAMLPWRGIRLGIAYGSAICLGLLGLLYFWPAAQEHFFPLTALTATGAMAGHWVYGAVLGWLTTRWLPPVGRRRRPVRDRSDRDTRSATVLVAVPDEPVGGHGKAVASGPVLTMPGGRLSSDELYAVKCTLQQPPRAHGFTGDQWTLRRVAMVVERATGVRGWQPAELRTLLEALDLHLPLRDRDQRGPRTLVS
jgi:hypothetical protein